MQEAHGIQRPLRLVAIACERGQLDERVLSLQTLLTAPRREGAIGINLGIWISKYLMVVPVFSPDNRPFQNLLDISIAVGLLAGFLVVLMLLCRRFPLFAQWEIRLIGIRRFPTA